jgi:type II secretory pathway pseudopilin PulG
MKNRFRKKGFTLMEVLIYISVLTILIVAIFSLLVWLMRSNVKTKVMGEALDNAKRAVETMAYEIGEAKTIYSPTSSSNQLSLETKKQLPEGETKTYLDFYICGTQLCLKRESQGPVAITSDKVEVANLTFTKIITGGKQSIQIDITVNYKNPSSTPEYNASVHLVSTASLRSY